MNERTSELIKFIETLPGAKLTHHPRLKNYEVSFKDGIKYLNGWEVLNNVKFFYETMKLERFDINSYSFHVLGKSITFPI